MGLKRQAVLDIGSDVITLILLDNRYANNFLYKGAAEYAGFQDGEFLDMEGLFKAIDGLIKECKDTAFCTPSEILVGVPGEFTTVVCKNVESSFASAKKITAKDVENLFEQGNTYDNHPNFKTINASPVYFINDKGQKSINPLELSGKSFTAFISYVLCERSFIDLFDRIAESLGVRFNYTSSILAELMFVVPPEIRDKGVILADIGYITSTVAYGKGDGILHSVSFSVGGGNIAGDLVTCLNIPFEHAMELVPKINLNLQPQPADLYTVSVRGEAFTYNIKDVNEVAYCRVQDIAETVKRCIDSSNTEIPLNIPLMLTGSGISSVVGAKDILCSATGRQVKIISADLLQFNKPSQSPAAGLIMVLQRQFSGGGLISKVKALLLRLRRNK